MIADRASVCGVVAAGATVAPSFLAFGCRGEQVDFYYKDFWQELLTEGILADKGLLTAFSRDQRQKVYVQDKLQEHSKMIWEAVQQVRSSCFRGWELVCRLRIHVIIHMHDAHMPSELLKCCWSFESLMQSC